MNITKSGFYKLSEINTSEINIGDDIVVAIFDDLNNDLDVNIGENSKVEFYGLLGGNNLPSLPLLGGNNPPNLPKIREGKYKINFIQNKQNSDLKVRYLLLSKNNNDLKAKIYSRLNSDNSKSNVKIFSIVGDNGFVDLDGIVKIEENITKVDATLIEENIFIGNNGRVKGIPTLLVRSDDVKASHSCRMERINDEQLFYLRSRGLTKQDSLNMILEAKVTDLFTCLTMYDKKFYTELKQNILKKI